MQCSSACPGNSQFSVFSFQAEWNAHLSTRKNGSEPVFLRKWSHESDLAELVRVWSIVSVKLPELSRVRLQKGGNGWKEPAGWRGRHCLTIAEQAGFEVLRPSRRPSSSGTRVRPQYGSEIGRASCR